MRRAPALNWAVIGSPRAITAAKLPIKGAVEKYAPVRAAPKCRNATTNKARLTPYPKNPMTPAMIADERWHRGADKKAEREIERSSNQPLQHHDLQRVRKRHLPW